MLGIWKSIRRRFSKYKKSLINRPLGLKSIGSNSIVRRPRILWGRERIHIGDNCIVMPHSIMQAVVEYEGKRYDSAIYIGDDVYIGRHVYLTAAQGIIISNGCVLSEHVYITDEHHGFNPLAGPIMKQTLECKGPVVIGPNCFLGYRVAVMPGVTLEEWCIVGANSVVTRSFPAYSMIAGSPARLIKIYSHELRQWVKPPVVPE